MYGRLPLEQVDVWNNDLLLLNREVFKRVVVVLAEERAIPLLADSNLGKPALIIVCWCAVMGRVLVCAYERLFTY